MAREVPQYVSQLAMGSMPKVQYSHAQADLTRKVSDQLAATAEDMNKKTNEIEELRVKTSLRENLHRIYNESPNDPALIKSKADGFFKEFLPNIGNATLQEKVSIVAGTELQPYLDKAASSHSDIVDQEHKLSQLTAISKNNIAIGQAAKALAVASSPEARESALKAIDGLVTDNANLAAARTTKGTYQFTPEKQMSVLLDGQRTILDSLPPDKRIEAVGGAKGGYEPSAALVRKHEGGLNISDGNTNNPAIFGINRKYHEKAFDEVKAVYDTQGFNAGQAAADAYLKKTYWDANKLDQLKPEQQGIVYDGLINHRTEFAKKLVEEARAGAPPSKLIDMRQEEYDRLAASGKYSKSDVASWNNRLNDYQHLILNEHLGLLDEDERKKVIKESIEQFKSEEEKANIMRVMDGSLKDTDIYNKFVANDPDILQNIEDYKNNGGDPELASYMRKSALTRNQLSAGEEDQIYTNIIDEVTQLKIKATSDGKVKIGNDDATLEDVVRLQKKIMGASIKGVKNLDSQLKKLSPAILELAKKERGKDDLGIDSFFGFFRSTEAYDTGYESIQKYLDGQDKGENYALKSEMMRDFISRADQIPEDIQKDDQLFQQAQEKIAQAVIAGQAQKGMKNIPTTAIQYLMANPSTSKQFDDLFGVGAASRVLGK